MEGLNLAVKAGKTRYIGISNCYAWQLAKEKVLLINGGPNEHEGTDVVMQEAAASLNKNGIEKTVLLKIYG